MQGQGKMMGFQKRRLPSSVLAASLLVVGWLVPFSHAVELGPQANSDPAQTAQEPNAQTQPKESPAKGATYGAGSASGQKFDPATVSAGSAAFERSCTKCHDAARSLERTKDLAGWRATVRRMAAKRGAEIAAGDLEPISVYLASRQSAASGRSDHPGTPGTAAGIDVLAPPA